MLSGKFESKVNTFLKSRLIGYRSNYINAIALQESFKAFHNSCNKIEKSPVIDKLVAKQKLDILNLYGSVFNLRETISLSKNVSIKAWTLLYL